MIHDIARRSIEAAHEVYKNAGDGKVHKHIEIPPQKAMILGLTTLLLVLLVSAVCITLPSSQMIANESAGELHLHMPATRALHG